MMVLVKDGEAVVSVLIWKSMVSLKFCLNGGLLAILEPPYRCFSCLDCADFHLLGITVGSIRHLCTAGQIIQPVQAGLLADGIDAAEQQVDVVGFPAPQRASQLSADKARDRARPQVRLVAHRVQSNVGLDIFGELHRVTRLARESNQGVLVQGSGLVIGGLEDRGSSHGRFRCCDDGEISPC